MKKVIDFQCSNCAGIRQIEKTKLSTYYGKKIKYTCTKCNSENWINVNAKLLNEQKANLFGFKTVVLNENETTNNAKNIAKIEVLSNSLTGRQELILKLGENIIGRKVESDDTDISQIKRHIITKDKKMSRNHCKIFVRKHNGKYDYFLSDNSSTNGTHHRNVKLGKLDEINLGINDEIKIGITTLKLVT